MTALVSFNVINDRFNSLLAVVRIVTKFLYRKVESILHDDLDSFDVKLLIIDDENSVYFWSLEMNLYLVSFNG